MDFRIRGSRLFHLHHILYVRGVERRAAVMKDAVAEGDGLACGWVEDPFIGDVTVVTIYEGVHHSGHKIGKNEQKLGT